MADLHGGRLVARALRRHGVERIFTLCGAHVQAIYDGCLDESIRVLDTRHEHTAVAAAEATSRLTNTTGVAVVPAGPGITNALTAVAGASKGGVPLVVIAGSHPNELVDMGALHEIDGPAMMKPFTKWAARVPSVRRIIEYIDTAFRRALTGLPGPVYLELPVDVLMASGPDTASFTTPLVPSPPSPAAQQVDALRGLFTAARRPVLLVGSQLRFSPLRHVLTEFADTVGVPVYLNGMARGALDPSHQSLFARSRRAAMNDADLIVVMGTPFDFRMGYGRSDEWNSQAAVVQVDLDTNALGHNRHVDLALHADAGATLVALMTSIGKHTYPEWTARLRDLEARIPTPQRPDVSGVCAHDVYEAVNARLGPNDVVIVDGGSFVAGAATAMSVRWPQYWLDAGPFGALGSGLGFAMASAADVHGGRTIGLFGDGAFGFHTLEFEALIRQNLPMVAIVGNDGGWSQVGRTQAQTYGADRVTATKLSVADYDKVVESLGGLGFRVETVEQLGPTLDAALSAGHPTCVNVILGE